MPQPMLDAFDCLPGIAFIPMAVESFCREAKLNEEVAGEILRRDFAAFLTPEADQGGFVAAHDNPGVGSAYKGTS
jgi:hypothetical protein